MNKLKRFWVWLGTEKPTMFMAGMFCAMFFVHIAQAKPIQAIFTLLLMFWLIYECRKIARKN
ncbi:MAG: hypothetical protein M0Q29_10005 [Thiopseudomonas sp.]|nr:hypothetical protein [Thiopseudomonas sp.]